MTTSTVPDISLADPEITAWMESHRRSHEGESMQKTLRAYIETRSPDGRLSDIGIPLRVLVASWHASLAQKTIADIPAGQGSASLFIAPADVLGYPAGDAALWVQTSDGPLFIRWAAGPGDSFATRALWEHLAATLPTVAEEA